MGRMMGANQAFRSFIEKTATGAGASYNFGEVRTKHSIQVIITGAPATCVVNLEGSLDGGTTWFSLGTGWTLTPQVSGDILAFIDKPVTSLRANLVTLTGGASPKVTAHIASV